jgi:hypothetical protein
LDDVPRPRERESERKRERYRENGRWYKIERADIAKFPKQNMQRETGDGMAREGKRERDEMKEMGNVVKNVKHTLSQKWHQDT